MKTNFRFLPAAALALLTIFTACEKETTTTGSDTELTTHSDDQSQVSVETDAIANEATLAVESSAVFSGSVMNETLQICSATISFDTSGATKKLTVVYNGARCSGMYTRTGTVVLSMPKGVYWKQAGAALTITYDNLKITRTSDKKSIVLNGSHVITNLSGGLLIQLATLQAITHTVTSSNLSVTFDDNTKRTWQVAQKRVFTYNNGVVITVTGNHSEGGNTGIVIWGTNRFGHAFTTSVTQPLVLREDCDFRLTSGAVMHAGFGTATATYGLDDKGNVTACPGNGAYYYKLDWTGPAGRTYSAIHPY